MARKANLFGKSRKIDNPYAIYRGMTELGETEVRVLKTYQHRDNERNNIYARWFVAVKTDATYGSYDMGDNYAYGIRRSLKLVDATPEWKEAYSR